MIYQEIIDIYKKMGIGTQEERNRFLQWYPNVNIQNNNRMFIIESPNSETVKGSEKCPVGTKS